MSSRSFRDRYNSLAGPARQQTPERRRDEWPLPSGGVLRATPDGTYAHYERRYSGPDIARARDELFRGSNSETDYLFLDTETTGLAGGTGTYAFLVGIGGFTGDDFVVRQYFMRHPGDEPGLLHAVESDLGRNDTTLVTYNGRSFDIPLLETRFRMHHRSLAVPEVHLDLLAPARAIWKHRLPSCSLGSIESEILGVRRDMDAPGWMIPSIYFGYLQHRRPDDLEAVLHHNSVDILSLARMTALVSAYRAGVREPDHPTDRAALALYRLRTAPCETTMNCAREAWRITGVHDDLRLRLLRELSTAAKRRNRHQDVEAEWTTGLGDRCRHIRAFAAQELSKYLEHKKRDYPRALRVATHAADSARLSRDLQLVKEFEHRIARLERKVRARSEADKSSKELQ